MTFWYGSGSGSAPLTNGFGSGYECHFVSGLQDGNKKCSKYFCLLLCVATCISFKEVTQQKVFFDPEPDPYLVITNPDQGGPKTYVTGSTTPLQILLNTELTLRYWRFSKVVVCCLSRTICHWCSAGKEGEGAEDIWHGRLGGRRRRTGHWQRQGKGESN